MKRTLALILSALMMLTLVAFGSSAEETTRTTAKATYGTPTIDGTIDACWNNVAVNEYGLDTKVTDSSATSCGQFRVMWDENYLYFLFEIKDSTMMDETTARTVTDWYARDQVALAFNPTNDYTATTGVGKTTTHFWYTYRPYGVAPNLVNRAGGVFFCEDASVVSSTAFNSQNFTDYPMEKRMYAYNITSDGYIIEAKVNITAAYSDWKNEAGKTLAFDTFVYGNDYTTADTAAAQDHVYPWADRTITSYKNNATKGQIELLANTNPSTGDNAVVFAVVAAVALMGSAIVVVKKHN